MKHFITIEGYPKSYERLLEFLRITSDYFEGMILKHTTNCSTCKGVGVVGSRGMYRDCPTCEGGRKI